ncbi:MAG: NUDIX domain-containing protein [Planctomycetota bacterium]
MVTRSAGILLYRRGARSVEVLLGHPGGPFFRRRDAGAWTIPKGLVEAGEEPLVAARRELAEETGLSLPDATALPLGEVVQKGGKRVVAWAIEADADPAQLRSNEVEMEWPRGSGRMMRFPEIDRLAWCTVEVAREKMNPAQVELVERLVILLGEVS